MRLSRTASVFGLAAALAGLGVGTANAAATLSKTVINPAGEAITINYSGFNPADGYVYVQQCRKDGNAPGVVFNYLTDCSQATGDQFVLTTEGGGAGSGQFTLFGGSDPNDSGWGCGPNTTVGEQQNATCYVRLASLQASNTSTDEFYPFTFGVEPEPEIPEVPLNVLLPLGAAAVIGGAVLVNRRRQSARAA